LSTAREEKQSKEGHGVGNNTTQEKLQPSETHSENSKARKKTTHGEIPLPQHHQMKSYYIHSYSNYHFQEENIQL
jgi:hypothetical protein